MPGATDGIPIEKTFCVNLTAMSLLLKALSPKLLNQTRPQFIVARSKMSAAEMPDGVTLTRRKIIGERVIVKDRREYGNVRSYIARWPEAGLHEWEHYKLVYVLAGRIDFQVGRYGVQCGEGYYLIIPPGMPQPDGKLLPYHARDSFCELLNVISHPHAVQCFITRAQPGQSYVEPLENYLFENGNLAALFHLLMEELVGGQNNFNNIGSALLSAFWLALQREVEAERYINPGPIGRPQEIVADKVGFESQLLRYIQAHITDQSLNLETVARSLYLSRAQFVRRMRSETGKTFIEYLTDYRIREAKVLLQDSNWTVSTIAGFLGFRSSTYFQAVFRKATGHTPSQYRRLNRKKS